MKKTISTLAFTLIFSSVWAQTAAPGTATMADKATAAAPVTAKDMTEAEVRKVDKDTKKVTLKHGPIKNLDMPSMTMVFQVRDPALLDKLVVGEKIKFNAEQLQGAFVVTDVERIEKK